MELLEKFYTVEEVAKLLKINSRTVAKLIKSNKIRALHIGGEKRKTFRVHHKELDRFLAEEYER